MPTFLNAETIDGKVVGVSDGDAITVLRTIESASASLKICLSEIDAPESSQAFGTQAKKHLSEKIFGETVTVEYHERDRYGRIIGKIYLDKRWINKEMVAEGFAWHYKQYSGDKELAKAELMARTKKLGLWVDAAPMPPWNWRTDGSQKYSQQAFGSVYWGMSPAKVVDAVVGQCDTIENGWALLDPDGIPRHILAAMSTICITMPASDPWSWSSDPASVEWLFAFFRGRLFRFSFQITNCSDEVVGRVMECFSKQLGVEIDLMAIPEEKRSGLCNVLDGWFLRDDHFFRHYRLWSNSVSKVRFQTIKPNDNDSGLLANATCTSVQFLKDADSMRVDITTTQGKTYEECRIVKTEPDGIQVIHSQGVAKISFMDLPKAYHEAYGYDPVMAAKYTRERQRSSEAYYRRLREEADRERREVAAEAERRETERLELAAAMAALTFKWQNIQQVPQPDSLDDYDTTDPTIDYVWQNSPVANNEAIIIRATVTDDVEVDSVTLEVDFITLWDDAMNDTGWNNEYTKVINPADLNGLGTYSYTITAEDTSGHTDSYDGQFEVTEDRITVGQPKPVNTYYWLDANTQVRHKKGCKYYKSTRGGNFVGPNQGKPCPLCGR